MSGLHGRMPYTTAFERAMGTGMIIQSATALDDGFRSKLDAFIDGYESVLSRFRADSLVTAMGESSHGGSFDFPDWASGLFDLADAFCTATDGALDPCVGEDLIRLGYDARYSMTMEPDAEHHLGAVHGRPTWRNDVERHGTTLVTQRAVHLDFGAFGKGYCADLIGAILDGHAGDETVRQSATGPGSHAPYIIDAGGDLLIRTGEPAQPAPLAEGSGHDTGDTVTIALEDPANPGTEAIGIASIVDGAFCASAPSRRHWGEEAGRQLHHLLNAVDGRPVRDVAASWVYVPSAAGRPYPDRAGGWTRHRMLRHRTGRARPRIRLRMRRGARRPHGHHEPSLPRQLLHRINNAGGSTCHATPGFLCLFATLAHQWHRHVNRAPSGAASTLSDVRSDIQVALRPDTHGVYPRTPDETARAVRPTGSCRTFSSTYSP